MGKVYNQQLVEEYVEILSPIYREILVIRHNASMNCDEVHALILAHKKTDEIYEDHEIINVKGETYRIYGSTNQSWELLAELDETLGIDNFILNLNPDIYNSAMVIAHNPMNDCDELYQLAFLSKEVGRARRKKVNEYDA